jgi:hypothetical protein
MSRRLQLRSFLFASLLLGVPVQAHAQPVTCNGGTSCQVSVDMALGITYVARLTLDQPSTTFGSVSAADFGNGIKNATGPSLTVQSNTSYRVEVQAMQPTWSYAGSYTNPQKPSSDLLWSTASNGTFNAANISTKFMPAGAGSAAATGSTSATIYFRSTWNWTSAPPGSYSLPISFTLVAP